MLCTVSTSLLQLHALGGMRLCAEPNPATVVPKPLRVLFCPKQPMNSEPLSVWNLRCFILTRHFLRYSHISRANKQALEADFSLAKPSPVIELAGFVFHTYNLLPICQRIYGRPLRRPLGSFREPIFSRIFWQGLSPCYIFLISFQKRYLSLYTLFLSGGYHVSFLCQLSNYKKVDSPSISVNISLTGFCIPAVSSVG